MNIVEKQHAVTQSEPLAALGAVFGEQRVETLLFGLPTQKDRMDHLVGAMLGARAVKGVIGNRRLNLCAAADHRAAGEAKSVGDDRLQRFFEGRGFATVGEDDISARGDGFDLAKAFIGQRGLEIDHLHAVTADIDAAQKREILRH